MTAVVRVDRFSVDRGIVEVTSRSLTVSQVVDVPGVRQDENVRSRSSRCGVLRRVRTQFPK